MRVVNLDRRLLRFRLAIFTFGLSAIWLGSCTSLSPLRPNIVTESDSINSLITEVGIGNVVAVVSQLFKLAVGKRLLYRPLVGTDATLCVGIACAKNADLTPAAERLCATIRKVAKT